MGDSWRQPLGPCDLSFVGETDLFRLPLCGPRRLVQVEKLSTASGCICLRIVRAEGRAVTRAHGRLGGIVGRDRAVALPVSARAITRSDPLPEWPESSYGPRDDRSVRCSARPPEQYHPRLRPRLPGARMPHPIDRDPTTPGRSRRSLRPSEPSSGTTSVPTRRLTLKRQTGVAHVSRARARRQDLLVAG